MKAEIEISVSKNHQSKFVESVKMCLYIHFNSAENCIDLHIVCHQ